MAREARDKRGGKKSGMAGSGPENEERRENLKRRGKLGRWRKLERREKG